MNSVTFRTKPVKFKTNPVIFRKHPETVQRQSQDSLEAVQRESRDSLETSQISNYDYNDKKDNRPHVNALIKSLQVL